MKELDYRKYVTKRIDALLDVIKKAAAGNLDASAGVGEKVNEFDALATGINMMIEEVKERTLELEDARNNLEEKVRARTKELQEAQAQLIQAGKMAAVGQLGAGVAHELNNPMGGILGYAQFILEKLNKPDFTAEDFQRCKKFLETIEKESQRCKSIVENLLRFSRVPKAGFEATDINKVIEDTLALIGYQVTVQKINITKDLASDLPKLTGNPSQLQQVFTNIILNAQKAIPEGGRLKITTKRIEKPERVEIKITDTGCGIPKENIDKIFEPFFTTGKTGKALGLGLALCYQIIQTHDGQIEVESEVGKGTTFTISLPKGGTNAG